MKSSLGARGPTGFDGGMLEEQGEKEKVEETARKDMCKGRWRGMSRAKGSTTSEWHKCQLGEAVMPQQSLYIASENPGFRVEVEREQTGA